MKRRRTQGYTTRGRVKERLAETLKTVRAGCADCAGKIKPTAAKASSVAVGLFKQVKAAVVGVYIGSTGEFWAVDIGDSGVCLARLKKNANNSVSLGDCFCQDFAPGSHLLTEDEQRDLQIAVLKELLQKAGAVKKNVVISIPGHSVFTGIQTLPPVSGKMLLNFVRHNVQQQIPFNLDQICLDHCILKKIVGPGDIVSGYEVLMAAIKSYVLDKYLAVFKEAGCCVHSVTTKAIAAFNWLDYSGQFPASKIPTAMVDIDARTTELVCAVDGRFAFTRPLKIGSISIDSLNIAEEQKETTDKLTGEIKRSFAYLRALPRGKKIEKVILTGSGASLAGLDDYFSSILGIEVVKADNFVGLSSIKIGQGSWPFNPYQLATVLGLALSCQQDVAVDINLLP